MENRKHYARLPMWSLRSNQSACAVRRRVQKMVLVRATLTLGPQFPHGRLMRPSCGQSLPVATSS